MNTKPNKKRKAPSIYTMAVHSGEREARYRDTITVPIAQSSTFVFSSSDEIRRYTSGKLARYEYGRNGNPTQRVAEEKLAALEGAEDCLLFDSGMSAVTVTLLALLEKGDHVDQALWRMDE